jgi:hypothetical protein
MKSSREAIPMTFSRKFVLGCRHREAEIIVARRVFPRLHEIEQLHQNAVVERGSYGMTCLYAREYLWSASFRGRIVMWVTMP